jgi:hypothetical protein
VSSCIVAGAHAVALTVGEEGVPFHEAIGLEVAGRAGAATVDVPVWRGLSFVPVLAWLVAARLTERGAPVEWWAAKKALPSVGRTLRGIGWELDGDVWRAPAVIPADPPPPRSFTVDGTAVDADWGVFSSHGLDPGTALLASVVRDAGPWFALSDVGAGVGVLTLTVSPERAVMSEVDSVALHLARGNMERAGINASYVFGADPTTWPPTEVTACNFPTHLPRPDHEALLDGLCGRARSEPVFIVVHASLQRRFGGAASARGVEVSVEAVTTHAVLRLTGRRAGSGTRRG